MGKNFNRYIPTADRGFRIWESPVTASHHKMNQEFIELGPDMNKEIKNRMTNPYVSWHSPLGLQYNRLFNSGQGEVVVLAISSTIIDGSPLILCGQWLEKREWRALAREAKQRKREA
jgi:hypothetical protein